MPQLKAIAPEGALHDGSIAIFGGLLLFMLPDGTGRKLLNWDEADRAPWGVIMMFGGGLALAAGIIESGLADWLGAALEPLKSVPVIVIAIALVALVILVTEFASNVATASGIMPVVASLILATGVDPVLLAVPAAMAASWGFMLPSGHRAQCHCMVDRAYSSAQDAEIRFPARSRGNSDHHRVHLGGCGLLLICQSGFD